MGAVTAQAAVRGSTQTRQDSLVEHSRKSSATAGGLSENQIHEARTREDRECLDVQMLFIAKGCFVLVEGTWFDEQGVLSELSGIADSVTGESFEVLRRVSPQLDAAWGTASARMKMGLEAEPLTWRSQQRHTKKMLSSEDRSMTRPEIRGSLCPGQNCPKQRKWNKRSWTNSCCQA